MLEANPNLGWRDVRLILAETARQNDPLDSDWVNTVPATGQPSYHINHKYGFGVVDASKAVSRAKTWTNNVVPQVVMEKGRATKVVIPDMDPNGVEQSVTFDAATDGELIIEYVEVDFDSDHPYPGDLQIVLTAPSGTQSVLAETHQCMYRVPNTGTLQPLYGTCASLYQPWTFGSSRDLGESSSGTWHLKVVDGGTESQGNLINWTLRLYGRRP
jgi:subtilisin-like proprotein convertase family protein